MAIDVMRLALVAELGVVDYAPIAVYEVDADDLARFAALVLEEASKVCETAFVGWPMDGANQRGICAAAIRALKPCG
jgi:hypothetical protein